MKKGQVLIEFLKEVLLFLVKTKDCVLRQIESFDNKILFFKEVKYEKEINNDLSKKIVNYFERKKIGINRRYFIKGVAAGMAVAYFSGCSHIIKNMKLSKQIKDPLGKMKHLKEGEYVVHDEVFEVYASIVDERSGGFTTPEGTCIDKNRLDDFFGFKKRKFFRRLEDKGYSSDEIEENYKIFTSVGNVILAENLLTRKSFYGKLVHERFHREQDMLHRDKLKELFFASKEMINFSFHINEGKKYGMSDEEIETEKKIMKDFPPDDRRILLVVGNPNNQQGSVASIAIESNWEEFFPYLAQGDLHPRVEIFLKENFSEAYKIYKEIYEKIKI